MVEQGLLPEIRKFYNEFKQLTEHKDYTKGVLQTIGFKEFIPYLEQYGESEDQVIEKFLKNSTNINDTLPPSLILLNSCLNELKLVTQRYSKKQVKWIKNRLLGNTTREVPPIYGLSSTDPSQWDQVVLNPAVNVVENYINDTECSIQPLPKHKTLRGDLSEEVSHYCETCERIFVGEFQWQLHLKSNRHKKVTASKKKNQLKRKFETETS